MMRPIASEINSRENGFDSHYEEDMCNLFLTPGSLEKYHLPPEKWIKVVRLHIQPTQSGMTKKRLLNLLSTKFLKAGLLILTGSVLRCKNKIIHKKDVRTGNCSSRLFSYF